MSEAVIELFTDSLMSIVVVAMFFGLILFCWVDKRKNRYLSDAFERNKNKSD